MKWKYYYFDTLQSTNDTATEYPVGSVIVAREQTAGRGRYGRVWISTAGNLFLSAVVPSCAEKTPLLSFVAALAVVKTLANYNAQIKWPNDILIDGGKAAGILLERIDDKVIVGIGINCKSAPQTDMLYQTNSLNNKEPIDAIQERLCTYLSDYFNLFQTQGFDVIRHEWLQYAIGIGQSIRVNLPTETLFGTFEALTLQGAISLKLPDNTTREITVGDIFFN